jgi:CO dehydrogenase/acetyl-CoA synthase alpha subunit
MAQHGQDEAALLERSSISIEAAFGRTQTNSTSVASGVSVAGIPVVYTRHPANQK